MEYLCGGWDVSEKIHTIQDIKGYIAKMELREPIPKWVMSVLDILEANDVPVKVEYTRLGMRLFLGRSCFHLI